MEYNKKWRDIIRILRGIYVIPDQEIQCDWNKIDKSEFCKDYIYLKENIGMEQCGQ